MTFCPGDLVIRFGNGMRDSIWFVCEKGEKARVREVDETGEVLYLEGYGDYAFAAATFRLLSRETKEES